MTKNKNIVFCIFFVLSFVFNAKVSAQEVRVIDNKGTIQTVNNNRVFTSATDPNLPTPITVENDIWFDTSSVPSAIKIWDGASWLNLSTNVSHTGTEGSVFFADTDGTPTEDPHLFWSNTATNPKLFIGNRPSGFLTGAAKLNVYGTTRTQGVSNSDGTVGQPSYRFSDDSNTGMFSPGADRIAFATGGASRLSIGNTSIFTDVNTRIQAILDVNLVRAVGFGSAAAPLYTFNPNTNVGMYSGGAGQLGFSTGGTEALLIDASQQVNIPNNLSVGGSYIDSNNEAGTAGQVLSSTVTGTDWIDSPAVNNWSLTGNSGTNPTTNFLGTTDAQDLVFRTNNTEAMRILQSNQYIGIGTTPTSPLHIVRNTPDPVGLLRLEGEEPDIHFNDTDGGFTSFTFENAGVPKTLIGRRDDDAFYISRNVGGTWFDDTFSILNSNGFTGIGITSATERLDVNGKVRIRDVATNIANTEVLTADANGVVEKKNLISTDANNAITAGTDGGVFYQSPIKAMGNVASNGSPNKIIGSTVSRISLGRYRVVLTTPRPTDNYVIQLTCFSDDVNNVPIITYFGQTTSQFDVFIEFDRNGSNQRTDFEFSFTVFDF